MNVYKPRYKIAFQSKNKIWPYKDSRLRRFFNIRGRKLVRRGLFKRYVVVLNNMKWTIARRYIRPYMRRRKAVRLEFKNRFYNKQKLRAFYGKIKEEKFRNFFKKHMHEGNKRNISLFSSLERRLDMFLFRLRLLPTIFACHQYILHYGVYINKGKINAPSSLVRAGDMLSISKLHWLAMYNYLKERIYFRVHGKKRMIKRKYKKLKKKTWWIFNKRKKQSLFYLLKFKRRYLDIFILEKKTDLDLFFKKLILLFKKLIFKKKQLNVLLDIKNILFNFYVLKHKVKNFIYMEKLRRKFFYFQHRKFQNQYKKLNLKRKKNKWRRNKEMFRSKFISFSLPKRKNKRFKIINKKTTPKLRWRLRLQKIKWIKLSKKWNKLNQKESGLDKKINKKLRKHTKKNKQNLNLQFIYLLKSISNTYYNWLSLLLQLKLNEINFYFWLLISIKGNNFNLNFEVQQILELWKNFLFLQASYIKKYITLYYQAFFRKFLRLETRKSFKKWKLIREKENNELILRKKLVRTGNLLTFFLIRRKLRMRRKKSVIRLKNIHWAIPNYIHFDLRTLRAVYLYSPMHNEITYSFKCSLTKIVSFYKALAL